jgi:hypothetical protein
MRRTGFWPIVNRGELAALYSSFFLYFAPPEAGPGASTPGQALTRQAPVERAALALARFLLPSGVDPAVLPLLVGRALRAFTDGYVAVLLPAYLLALGFGQFDVGLLSTATLAGSALATLAVGAIGHRWSQQALLLGAALLMFATGLGFAGVTAFWPLLIVAFFGTINPGSGDVSVFLPLEHARLAHAAEGNAAPHCSRATRSPVRCAGPWARWPRACPPG